MNTKIEIKSLIPNRAVFSILLFIISFSIYLFVLCPTVYWGDCGEFIVAANTLGVAHSPGHPLYTLMGRIFALLPLGNSAFRINLMSAFFCALTVSLLPFIKISDETRWWQLFAAIILIFNLAFWRSALTAEIYPLHHFFLALLLVIFTHWWRVRRENLLLLFVFIFGFSLTNNPTYIFLIPLFRIMMFVRRGWSVKISDLKFTFFFFLGLSPYFYLILRSQADPIIDWGNPDTISQFFWVVTGKEFAGKVTSLEYAPEIGFVGGIINYFKTLPHQFSWLIAPFFILGIFRLFQKSKYFFTITLSIFAINIAYSLAFWGESLALESYLIPSYIMLCLWAGMGVAWIYEYISKKWNHGNVKYSIIVLLLLILILPIAINRFRHEDKSESTTAYFYGKGICDTFQNAHCIFLTENTLDLFLTLYHQQMENRAENTIPIYLPYLKFGWYKNQIEQKYAIKIPNDGNWLKSDLPVYYSPDASFNFRVDNLLPQGLIYKLVEISPDSVSLPDVGEYDYEKIGDDELPSRRRYGLLYSRLGNYFHQKNDPEKTLYCYQTAKEIFPENPNIHYNLGYYFHQQNEFDAAIKNYKRAIELNPDLTSAHYNLGTIYLRLNDLDQAKYNFIRALKADKNHVDARYQLASLYFKQRKINLAITEYEKIIDIDPNYANAYKDLGFIYVGSNQKRIGKTYLKKYLELNPKSQYKETIERIIHEN